MQVISGFALELLPAEAQQHILGFLPLEALGACTKVSRSWHACVTLAQHGVWRPRVRQFVSLSLLRPLQQCHIKQLVSLLPGIEFDPSSVFVGDDTHLIGLNVPVATGAMVQGGALATSRDMHQHPLPPITAVSFQRVARTARELRILAVCCANVSNTERHSLAGNTRGAVGEHRLARAIDEAGADVGDDVPRLRHVAEEICRSSVATCHSSTRSNSLDAGDTWVAVNWRDELRKLLWQFEIASKQTLFVDMGLHWVGHFLSARGEELIVRAELLRLLENLKLARSREMRKSLLVAVYVQRAHLKLCEEHVDAIVRSLHAELIRFYEPDHVERIVQSYFGQQSENAAAAVLARGSLEKMFRRIDTSFATLGDSHARARWDASHQAKPFRHFPVFFAEAVEIVRLKYSEHAARVGTALIRAAAGLELLWSKGQRDAIVSSGKGAALVDCVFLWLDAAAALSGAGMNMRRDLFMPSLLESRAFRDAFSQSEEVFNFSVLQQWRSLLKDISEIAGQGLSETSSTVDNHLTTLSTVGDSTQQLLSTLQLLHTQLQHVAMSADIRGQGYYTSNFDAASQHAATMRNLAFRTFEHAFECLRKQRKELFESTHQLYTQLKRPKVEPPADAAAKLLEWRRVYAFRVATVCGALEYLAAIDFLTPASKVYKLPLLDLRLPLPPVPIVGGTASSVVACIEQNSTNHLASIQTTLASNISADGSSDSGWRDSTRKRSPAKSESGGTNGSTFHPVSATVVDTSRYWRADCKFWVESKGTECPHGLACTFLHPKFDRSGQVMRTPGKHGRPIDAHGRIPGVTQPLSGPISVRSADKHGSLRNSKPKATELATESPLITAVDEKEFGKRIYEKHCRIWLRSWRAPDGPKCLKGRECTFMHPILDKNTGLIIKHKVTGRATDAHGRLNFPIADNLRTQPQQTHQHQHQHQQHQQHQQQQLQDQQQQQQQQHRQPQQVHGSQYDRSERLADRLASDPFQHLDLSNGSTTPIAPGIVIPGGMEAPNRDSSSSSFADDPLLSYDVPLEVSSDGGFFTGMPFSSLEPVTLGASTHLDDGAFPFDQNETAFARSISHAWSDPFALTANDRSAPSSSPLHQSSFPLSPSSAIGSSSEMSDRMYGDRLDAPPGLGTTFSSSYDATGIVSGGTGWQDSSSLDSSLLQQIPSKPNGNGFSNAMAIKDWTSFVAAAGLSQSQAAFALRSLRENEIDFDQLSALDKDLLRDIGIKPGPSIRILQLRDRLLTG